MNINDYIDLKAGTVNFKKKMSTIFDRVKEECSEGWLLDDNEIHKMFTRFYDEIDDLIERNVDDSGHLEWLKDTYVIPMLTDEVTIHEYKQRAYEAREKEFYEMKREEEAEKDFACENGMDSEYWCQACQVGICDDHGDRVSEFDIPTRNI